MSPPWNSAAAQYGEKELGKVFDSRLARRLATYLRPYIWLVVTAIILAITTAALRVTAPWIARHIIDNLLPANTPTLRHSLNIMCGMYLGLIATSFFVNFAMTYLTAWVGQRAMYDLRKDIFEKLHKLSLSYFDRTPSGRLLTRTTSDVVVLNEMFGQGVVNIFTDVVLLLGISIAWVCFDWRLGLILIMVAPLLAVASYNFRIRARSAYRAVRIRIAAMSSFLAEHLAGIRTVQSFRREETSKQQYATLNATYRDAQVETVKHYARFFPLVDAISFLAIICVLAYGGWMAVGGTATLSAGDFFLYFQYIAWFFMPITNLAERYNIFQAAMASSERIFELLDEEVEVQDPQESHPVAPLKEGVELRNVWFSYMQSRSKAKTSEEAQEGSLHYGIATNGDSEWILRDVSLRVKKGQTIALVGATGAGKSTVINLISRLYDVQKGSVLFDGQDVKTLRQDDLRRRMAIVLQDVFLFSGTIAENIRLGNSPGAEMGIEISDEEVEQAAKHVNAHKFISRLPGGYNSPVLERGATLSTGQKQLLAFARAVAFKPDLLILDEATANIDTETEMLIQDALDKLMHERTCIIIAHRLSTIQKADRIVVFNHGRIHEEGSHQELLRRDGLYRKLYELQYLDSGVKE